MAIGKHYDLDTDGTLANNSDNTIASQKAVKTYVDSKTIVDSALSDSSTNPVQNKVIKSALDNKQDTLATQTAYSAKGSATKVPQITTNTLGQVTGITEIDITHQSIKTLKTDNTTAQSTSSSEAIAGNGTINLHKISKTGTFSDLLSKPTSISGYGITDAYTKTEVDGMISSVYKPAGSVAFASLPTLASNVLGNVYNVTDAFTTTTDFVEGSGKSYPAGTNVVVVEPTSGTYKFDVLAGFVDLSGYVPTTRTINSKALSADITLTASDVGAISSHQSIKTLNTNNTTAQTANASEDIAGSGSISLHKVSKTGSYNDLLNKPTKLSDFTDDLGTSPVHSHSQYLPLSGGTMTGAIKFASGSLTQNTSPVYMLTMDAFADGGELKWISVANIKAGKDASGNTITTTYATKSEATRVKFRDWSAS